MCAFDWNNQLIKRYENDINKIRTWWFDLKCTFFESDFPPSWLMVFNRSPTECLTKSMEGQNRWKNDNFWCFVYRHRFSFKQIECTDSTTWLMFSAAKIVLARSTWSMDNIFWFLNQRLHISRQVGFVYGNAAGVMSQSCHHVIIFFWKQGWLAVLNGIPFENNQR